MKCFFWVVSYTFAWNGAYVITPNDPSWYISIKDSSDGPIKQFKVISPYILYGSLGVI